MIPTMLSVMLLFGIGQCSVLSSISHTETLADSVSVSGVCYCLSQTYNGIGTTIVDVNTIKAMCDSIGPAPDQGVKTYYNDIQCGNGPPANQNEAQCPGVLGLGSTGCSVQGPKFVFQHGAPCMLMCSVWMQTREGRGTKCKR